MLIMNTVKSFTSSCKGMDLKSEITDIVDIGVGISTASTKSQEDYTCLQPLKTIANACSTYERYEFTPFCNVL